MIKIGANDNVVLTKTEINDKGTLVIGAAEIGTEIKEKKETSFLDDMSDGSDTSGQTGTGETTFLMYMPQLVKFEKDAQGNEVPAEGKDVMAAFIDLKNQLSHFLKRFIAQGQIKFAPFAGVAINLADEKAVMAAIVTKAVAEKVYANYAQQFIEQAKPYLNMVSKPSRLFLHRQNAAKHYGTLRKKFLDAQPFFESMDIQIQDSKMYIKQTDKTTKLHDAIEVDGIKYVPNFSKYELDKGLDDPRRVEATADTSSEDAEQEIENVENLFSTGDVAATSEESEFKIEE